MKISSVVIALCTSIALVGCVETSGFGGSGGTGGFGGSGGSGDFGGSEAGERLARQVCAQEIRNSGQQVVEVYRTRALDYPYRGAGVDLFFSTRRDPMTASLSYTRCRFTYEDGRATLTSLLRP